MINQLATVHKLETYTVTFIIRECCITRLQKVLLDNTKVPLEVGLQVYYEAVRSDKSFLPKLSLIRKCTFDNCVRCGLSFVPDEIYLPEESQLVGLILLNIDLNRFQILY